MAVYVSYYLKQDPVGIRRGLSLIIRSGQEFYIILPILLT